MRTKKVYVLLYGKAVEIYESLPKHLRGYILSVALQEAQRNGIIEKLTELFEEGKRTESSGKDDISISL